MAPTAALPWLGTVSVLALVAACGSDARAPFDAPPSPSPAPSAPGGGDPNLGSSGNTPGGPCVGGGPALTPAPGITIDPAFAAQYHAYTLGQVPGMPAYKYGGIVLDKGSQDLLLVGGNANDANGGIWAIEVVRGACKHIVGWKGAAKRIANAPHIDGGLVYGPSGALMFTGWPANVLGVIPPSSSTPARTIYGDTLGIPESLAALAFVPAGFPGEGKLKLVTWEAGGSRRPSPPTRRACRT